MSNARGLWPRLRARFAFLPLRCHFVCLRTFFRRFAIVISVSLFYEDSMRTLRVGQVNLELLRHPEEETEGLSLPQGYQVDDVMHPSYAYEEHVESIVSLSVSVALAMLLDSLQTLDDMC